MLATGRRRSPETRSALLEPLAGASLAALTVGLGMLVLRSALGVRSIPERLMEWLLLFIPSAVFESIIRRFGFDAKRYGLAAAILLLLGLLVLALATMNVIHGGSSGISRLWAVSSSESGTTEVRQLIWKGSETLIKEQRSL